MTDMHAAFRVDIIAHKDDDAPRLIYADWLDEHAGMVECRACRGEGRYDADNVATERVRKMICRICNGTGLVSNGFAERAEFCRVQCELAKHPATIWAQRERESIESTGHGLNNDPAVELIHQAEALRRREEELLRGGTEDVPNYYAWARWLLEMYKSRQEPVPFISYHRGFVESLTATATDFLAHADVILKREPLRRVRLATMPQVYASTWRPLETTHPYFRSAQEVTLALKPAEDLSPIDPGIVPAEGILKMLKSHFPGIEFELPIAR